MIRKMLIAKIKLKAAGDRNQKSHSLVDIGSALKIKLSLFVFHIHLFFLIKVSVTMKFVIERFQCDAKRCCSSRLIPIEKFQSLKDDTLFDLFKVKVLFC